MTEARMDHHSKRLEQEMNRELRRLHGLLVASWLLFSVLAILNAVAVSTGFYYGVCR